MDSEAGACLTALRTLVGSLLVIEIFLPEYMGSAKVVVDYRVARDTTWASKPDQPRGCCQSLRLPLRFDGKNC